MGWKCLFLSVDYRGYPGNSLSTPRDVGKLNPPALRLFGCIYITNIEKLKLSMQTTFDLKQDSYDPGTLYLFFAFDEISLGEQQVENLLTMTS